MIFIGHLTNCINKYLSDITVAIIITDKNSKIAIGISQIKLSIVNFLKNFELNSLFNNFFHINPLNKDKIIIEYIIMIIIIRIIENKRHFAFIKILRLNGICL